MQHEMETGVIHGFGVQGLGRNSAKHSHCL